MRKILLTTIHRPLGVENETSTRNITSEAYHAQITVAQGPFGIRAHRPGLGLDFIAANLKTPTTVMHYPTRAAFIRELRRGYDFVGIGFVVCTFPKAVELCALVRRYSPGSKIVLGGYGTVLPECDRHADYVCREEGVGFFRRLLGEDGGETFVVPPLQVTNRVLSVAGRPETVIPTALGCSRGCEFCATSHFFERRRLPLLRTSRAIHEAILATTPAGEPVRNVSLLDEDLLADREMVLDLAARNARETEKPIFVSCFSTLKSVDQYTNDELLDLGLAGVWMGVESKRARYPKLEGVDAGSLVARLRNAGVNVLVSMIVGYDWQDERGVEDDFQYLLSLRPALSQIMIYSPCPQTPLHARLRRENRLLSIPPKYHDGFHLLFRHPHFDPPRLEALLHDLLRRENEELGPSIFRILDTQLRGYETWREDPRPLGQARAREHRRFCLQVFPFLRTGIATAPSPKVKAFLKDLRDRLESRIRIPAGERWKEWAVPALYAYTRMRDRAAWLRQPRPEVRRFHYAGDAP